MGVKFGLGDDKLILDEMDGASLFIVSDVEFVHHFEILGDVDWFLWECEFAAGLWEDEPINLFVEFVRAQVKGGVGTDSVIVDAYVGHGLVGGIKDIEFIFVFTWGRGNRVLMKQLMSCVHLVDLLEWS